MFRMYKSVIVIGIVMLGSRMQADVLDFLRRPEDRRDVNTPEKEEGLGFYKYKTESGEEKTHWAPLKGIEEGMFGPREQRSNQHHRYAYEANNEEDEEEQPENEEEYEEEY